MEETEVLTAKVVKTVVAQYLQASCRAGMAHLDMSHELEGVDPAVAKRIEAQYEGPVTGVGSAFEWDVRARDEGGPAPSKGQRPWHYYRVTVTEHETARG